MLPVAIVFAFILIICSVFLYEGPSTENVVFDIGEYDEGRILGISEAAAVATLDRFREQYNGLPRSNKNSLKILSPRKKSNDLPDIHGCIGIVLDKKSGLVLFESESEKQVPIASITKLATALVFLDNDPDWEMIYTIKSSDITAGARIYLSASERIRIRDLFFLSLVGSANTATRALSRSTGLSDEEFVNQMNEKMLEIGLSKTVFVDPIGLSFKNRSTAYEVASLAKIALSSEEIKQASLTKKYEFKTVDGVMKAVLSTNSLLNNSEMDGIELRGGKTGFIKAAGYCYVGAFADSNGNEIISVVLGGDTVGSRFKETRELVNWTYNSFIW
ncbi:serine hydrolase [bacterium]|nr:serine hydrolase [bacterium]